MPPSEWELFDSEFDAECSLIGDGNDVTRCYPSDVRLGGSPLLFAGSACSESLAPENLVFETQAAEEAGVLRLPFWRSGSRARRLGEPFNGQPYTLDGADACVPATGLDGAQLYQLGEDVSVDEFVEYRTVER